MRALTVFASALASGLICVISFHLAVGDQLLFASDFYSLAVYLGAAGAAVGLLLLAGILLAGLLPRSSHRSASALLALFCLAGFLAAVGTMISAVLRRAGFSDYLAAAAEAVPGPWLLALTVLMLLGGLALLYRVILRLLARQPEMTARLDSLGLVICGAAALALAAGWFMAPVGSSQAEGAPPRHLVLVIIDRMPSWAMQNYRQETAPTAFDAALKDQVRVFHNMQSARPQTHGFFGTLYRGRLEGDPVAGNLLSRLDGQAVDITLMYDHRNASPEGSSARISNYRGLRSRLLGPDSARLPRSLGLQTHLALVAPRPNEGLFLRPLWEVLNPGQPRVGVLEEVLLPVLKQSARRSRRSFTLFHISLSRFNDLTYADRSPQFAGEDENRLISASRENGYRYVPGPGADDVIRQYYDFVLQDVGRFAEQFRLFFEKLRQDPALRDTAVIVTADHGIIYDKGRLFYGYHPQREVVRVPFLLLGGLPPGSDRRLFGTLDLSHSILDYFGAGQPPLAGDAVSLFGAGAREEIATLTQRSDYQKEWFLVIFRGGQAFRINLHPDAETSVEAVGYDEFEEIPMAVSEETRRDLLSKARHWVARFGVDPGETNLPAG